MKMSLKMWPAITILMVVITAFKIEGMVKPRIKTYGEINPVYMKKESVIVAAWDNKKSTYSVFWKIYFKYLIVEFLCHDEFLSVNCLYAPPNKPQVVCSDERECNERCKKDRRGFGSCRKTKIPTLLECRCDLQPQPSVNLLGGRKG